jgi:hypothetical protein
VTGATDSQAAAQGLAEILHNLIDTNATHGTNSKGTDQWVGILRILQKRHNDV